MTRTIEYYQNRINQLKHRQKDNTRIIQKLERKVRQLSKIN